MRGFSIYMDALKAGSMWPSGDAGLRAKRLRHVEKSSTRVAPWLAREADLRDHGRRRVADGM
jgi:hypothetical protein